VRSFSVAGGPRGAPWCAGDAVKREGRTSAAAYPSPEVAIQLIGVAARLRRAKAPSKGMPEFIDVDPGELHLPPSRPQGADRGKLTRQVAKHGNSLDGMPPLQLVRGKDGILRINDGVTQGDACR